MTSTGSGRNHGIDLLRILATGMIIVHHFICHGGLSAIFPQLSRPDVFYHSVNILCYCAVNLYGLISGYVGVGRRFRPSRLIGLWMQAAFTSLVIYAGFMLFGGMPFSLKDLFTALTPLSHDTYWYFTAYAGMYLFLPFLHKVLDHADRRFCLTAVGTAFVLFSLLPTLADRDIFQLQYGYHMGWLMVLYATGCTCKRFGFGWLKRWALPMYAACMLTAIGGRIVLETLHLRGFAAPSIVLLEKYTSPTLYLGSLALLCLFAHLRLRPFAARVAAAISPFTFGVYLFHAHPLVYHRLIHLSLTPLVSLSAPVQLLILAAVCLAVYVLCLMLDYLRVRLFGLVRIPSLCAWLEKKLLSFADA